MKASKKFKVLNGITGIRVRMGVTQLALAQYLGISKSLVSMVENGHRRLPDTAFSRLTELEIQLYQSQLAEGEPAYKLPAYEESAYEKVIRETRQQLNCTRLRELRNKVNLMLLQYTDSVEALRQLDRVIRLAGATAGASGLRSLEQGRQRLVKKIKRCDSQARAKVEGKMAMLEVIVAAYSAGYAAEVIEAPAEVNTIAATGNSIPKGYTLAAGGPGVRKAHPGSKLFVLQAARQKVLIGQHNFCPTPPGAGDVMFSFLPGHRFSIPCSPV